MAEYAYERKKLKDLPEPLILPVGFPFQGQLQRECEIKGLPLKTRRKLGRILQAQKIDLHAVSSCILEDCLVRVGPYRAGEKPIETAILDQLPIVDREFICWMAVMENYRPPYDEFALREIPAECIICGHREHIEYDPWRHTGAYIVGPEYWELGEASISYQFTFMDQEHRAIVPTGLSEKAMSGSDDPTENIAKYISQVVIEVDGKPSPYRKAFIEEQPFFWVDRLFKACNLDPKPGIDSSWEMDCPKCGNKISEVVSFIPFLFPRGD